MVISGTPFVAIKSLDIEGRSKPQLGRLKLRPFEYAAITV